MIRKLLLKLTDRLPARVISEDGEDYLIRFYLATLFGRRMYLHLFLNSDPDRGIHNHPWTKAWSFILAGWYFEERRGPSNQGGRRTVKVKWFNRLTADTCHRVILPTTRPVWTLFIHTVGDVQEWGFFKRLTDKTPWRGVKETYTPFVYPGGKKDPEWWKSAPTGKALRESRYIDGQWGGQFPTQEPSRVHREPHRPLYVTSHPRYAELLDLARESVGICDLEPTRAILLGVAGVKKVPDVPYDKVEAVINRLKQFINAVNHGKETK